MSRLCSFVVLGLEVGTGLLGCHRGAPVPPPPPDGSPAVGRFKGGVVTQSQLLREERKMPPDLRAQFRSEAGQRELVRSMIDKELLFDEAKRQGFQADPEIRHQVHELEERLTVQALLNKEELAQGAASEHELRAYYESHHADLEEKERVHVSRALVRVDPAASTAEKAHAKAKAQKLAQRLSRGEPMARVSADGEGPERARGGDLGLLAAGDLRDRSLEKAAFALTKPGAVSPVFSCEDGFAVLQLIDRRPSRSPSFEEARAQIALKLGPQRKRQVFDQLIAKLRKDANVEVGVSAQR